MKVKIELIACPQCKEKGGLYGGVPIRGSEDIVAIGEDCDIESEHNPFSLDYDDGNATLLCECGMEMSISEFCATKEFEQAIAREKAEHRQRTRARAAVQEA